MISTPGFVQAEECQILSQMLDAWKAMDPDAFQIVVSKQVINFLDNEVIIYFQLRKGGWFWGKKGIPLHEPNKPLF